MSGQEYSLAGHGLLVAYGGRIGSVLTRPPGQFDYAAMSCAPLALSRTLLAATSAAH